MSITKLIGFACLGFFAVLGISMLPDLTRYIKISTM
jgi:hypothetical protein